MSEHRHHKNLRRFAKLAAFFVLADLVAVLWLASTGYFPLDVLGITFPETSVLPLAVFDIAILIILVHFGWHITLPVQSPTEKNLLVIAGVVFGVVSLAHLLRLAFGLDIVIGSFYAPGWLSWVGIIITGYLSYSSFHFARQK